MPMPRLPWKRARCGRAVPCLLLALAPTLAAQEPITLPQAVELALRQGHPARAAAATRDAARYRDQAFRSRLLPQLALSGTVPAYNRRIIEVLQPDGSTVFRSQNQTGTSLNATLSQTLPVTGGQFFVSSSLARLSVSGDQDLTTWSSTPVAFGLRQPIFRVNTEAWDRREQPVRLELAERQYQEALADIALETAGLFFDVYAAEVALENATTNVAVNDTLYTLNRGRYEVGRIGENDLLQSELALLRARTTLDGARLERERALDALRLALHLPPGTLLTIQAPVGVPPVPIDTAAAITQALRHRAVVTDAELADVQARRRIAEARRGNGPGATLLASFGFNATGPGAGDAYRDLLEARQFSLGLEIPLIQWGAGREAVRAAEADRERLESTTRSMLDRTAHEARFAALQLAQAGRRLALSATADTVAAKRFEVAYNRYVIGRIAMDNLYLAQNEKDQARIQYAEALRAYWTAYYRLRRVTMYDFESGRGLR